LRQLLECLDLLTSGQQVELTRLDDVEISYTPSSRAHNPSPIQVLEGLDLSMDQFIDLCILMGSA
jgi:hypothetical protein